ncbi:hypothetical protein BSL78_18428 [Apostichopus japonicus]|uniref:Uncharacterized protein n=1 Tax=Stichopus japonicus TaxID=307972 RepID=A0A2G8K9P6_STIJA|nr:hypothetical protein BSL78_18428 [Apostichopus japonicus]
MLLFPAVSQIIQDQAEAGSKTEAESANPSMDQTEDWKHHQVQCQETALEENKASLLEDDWSTSKAY